MATAKSDDETEERSHPLAHNRPGVYVQVVAPRRRKGRRPAEPGSTADERESLPSSDPILTTGESVSAAPQPAAVTQSFHSARFDSDSERESGERGVGFEEAQPGIRSESENSNHRADLMIVSLPPPPRLPSFDAGSASERARLAERSASLLDAPPSLRPDSMPSGTRPSLALLAFVVALSAIIATAALVALRESTLGDESSEPARPSPAPPGAVRREDPANLPQPSTFRTSPPAPVLAAPVVVPLPALPAAPAAATPRSRADPRASTGQRSAQPGVATAARGPRSATVSSRVVATQEVTAPEQQLTNQAVESGGTGATGVPSELPENPYD